MAHIFVGDTSKVDPDVMERVQSLPDDFWVFVEFTLDRNVDWFVTRASQGGQPSTLIVTELKRCQRALDGSVDGPWKVRTEGGLWEEITPSNQEDTNYYWQAVHTANALAWWLWNNQNRFLPPGEERTQNDFKVWPDLLLLSPPGTLHSLPRQPTSKFGQWWYNLDTWAFHLQDWKPKFGVPLSAEQLEKIAELLGLQRIEKPRSQFESRPVVPGPDTVQAGSIMAFCAWLQNLEARVSDLERRVGGGTH